MRLKPPKFIRWLMPDLIWEMKDRSAVYLTFDDGHFAKQFGEVAA